MAEAGRAREDGSVSGQPRQAPDRILGDTDPVVAVDRSCYVTVLFRTPEDASRAYGGLITTHGYSPDDVDVVMSDETRTRHFGDAKPGEELKTGSKVLEGLGAGSAIGAGIGAALAALLAVGSAVAIPGLGLVVAGPIAAALAGAGAGAVTGGVIGALVGVGIPEERAREYEQGVREGGIVVGARARDDEHAAELERELASYGGTTIRR